MPAAGQWVANVYITPGSQTGHRPWTIWVGKVHRRLLFGKPQFSRKVVKVPPCFFLSGMGERALSHGADDFQRSFNMGNKLTGIPETMLIPLWARASETVLDTPIIRDEQSGGNDFGHRL